MSTELKRMQQRRDVTADWESDNPVLLSGELGLDTTLNLFKVGDGTTEWLDLPYIDFSDAASIVAQQMADPSSPIGSVLADEIDDRNEETVPGLVADAIADDDTVALAAAAAVEDAAAGLDLVLRTDPGAPNEFDGDFINADDGSRVSYLDLDLDADGRLVRGITGEGVNDLPLARIAGATTETRDIVGNYAIADVDADGRILESALGPDGCVPDWVLARWARRSGEASAGAGDLHWAGDSMTAALAVVRRLEALTGRIVHYNGVGGEQSPGIAARTGAIPYLLLPAGGSIPTSGAVDVAVTDARGGTDDWPLLRGNTDPFPYTGTLKGVPGTFALTTEGGSPTGHDAGDVYTFTRTTPGTAVTCDRPEPLLLDYPALRLWDTTIIWAGRNNFDDPERVKADVRAMVGHLRGADPRFLVLSICNGTGEGNPSSIYTQITTLNAELEREWGRHYVDVRRYLVQYGLSDKAITPVSQDTTDMAADTVPVSLRVDGLHLNVYGCQVVEEQAYRRLVELGYL